MNLHAWGTFSLLHEDFRLILDIEGYGSLSLEWFATFIQSSIIKTLLLLCLIFNCPKQTFHPTIGVVRIDAKHGCWWRRGCISQENGSGSCHDSFTLFDVEYDN